MIFLVFFVIKKRMKQIYINYFLVLRMTTVVISRTSPILLVKLHIFNTVLFFAMYVIKHSHLL